MFGLTLFKPTNQAVKDRVLKNNEALLDVMAKNIKGARQCPYLSGNKCIGEFCEFFQPYKFWDPKEGTEKVFYRCVHLEIPDLLIELNRNIRDLIQIHSIGKQPGG
jgi:hypothetical protein